MKTNSKPLFSEDSTKKINENNSTNTINELNMKLEKAKNELNESIKERNKLADELRYTKLEMNDKT